MLLNIIARNLGDHTKNISFLMGPDGKWKLSPAYDVIYAHNPVGKWTSQHQLSANGKRDNFTRENLLSIGESISLSRPEEIINDVVVDVEKWPELAKEAGVKKEVIQEISKHQRTNI